MNLQEFDVNKIPYLANKNWTPGNPVYYSGPYWDEKEVSAMLTALTQGKWIASGEEVNKFERQFSKKFGFRHSLKTDAQTY